MPGISGKVGAGIGWNEEELELLGETSEELVDEDFVANAPRLNSENEATKSGRGGSKATDSASVF